MSHRLPFKQLCICLLTLSFGGIVVNPALSQTLPDAAIEQTSFNNRSDYILGPGDQLDIEVFDYEEFTGSKVILPDGTITLPMLGQVEAAGRTADQLAEELTAQLDVLLVNPVVTVGLSVLRPVSVTVSGEVQRPGPIQLRSLTTTNLTVGGNTIEGTPTVSTALVEAGGVTRHADIRQVTLRRSASGGEPVVLNLWDAIASDNPPPDFVLQDGDSIYIPRLNPEDTLDRRLVARASFAPNTVRVRVVGEVINPGEVQVSPDSTISSAVATAGGPSEDADLDDVEFIRLNEDGGIDRQTINLENLIDNYQVQEGDVIVVPKRGVASLLDFASRLLNPVNSLIRLIIP